MTITFSAAARNRSLVELGPELPVIADRGVSSQPSRSSRVQAGELRPAAGHCRSRRVTSSANRSSRNSGAASASPGEGQALGQGVEHRSELEPAQDARSSERSGWVRPPGSPGGTRGPERRRPPDAKSVGHGPNRAAGRRCSRPGLPSVPRSSIRSMRPTSITSGSSARAQAASIASRRTASRAPAAGTPGASGSRAAAPRAGAPRNPRPRAPARASVTAVEVAHGVRGPPTGQVRRIGLTTARPLPRMDLDQGAAPDRP